MALLLLCERDLEDADAAPDKKSLYRMRIAHSIRSAGDRYGWEIWSGTAISRDGDLPEKRFHR
jgi:hypothetical protein